MFIKGKLLIGCPTISCHSYGDGLAALSVSTDHQSSASTRQMVWQMSTLLGCRSMTHTWRTCTYRQYWSSLSQTSSCLMTHQVLCHLPCLNPESWPSTCTVTSKPLMVSLTAVKSFAVTSGYNCAFTFQLIGFYPNVCIQPIFGYVQTPV